MKKIEKYRYFPQILKPDEKEEENASEIPECLASKHIASPRPHTRPDSQHIETDTGLGVGSTILRIWSRNHQI